MADQAPQAPDAGGGFSFSTLPTWAYFAIGGVLIGGYLLWRRRGQSAGASSTLPDQSVSPIIDPTTGGLIDPSTGAPYIGSAGNPQDPSNDNWLAAAQQASHSLGYAPGLVDQALYNFLNGNPLTNAQAGVINTILGKIGFPPVQVPFLGNPTPTPPKPTKAPKAGYVWELVNGVWRQIRYASQGPVPKNPIRRTPGTPNFPGGPIPIPKMPGGGTFTPRPVVPGVGQRPTPHSPAPRPQPYLLPAQRTALTFIDQVLRGAAPLPQGVAVPAGYHLRSGSRYLVKNAS